MPKAFKHRNMFSSSTHFKYLSWPFPTFPFQYSLRNSHIPCLAIARHSGSAIDKDQRSDTGIGKGIRQQKREKPELRFLLCTSSPGNPTSVNCWRLPSPKTQHLVDNSAWCLPSLPSPAQHPHLGQPSCLWEDAVAVTNIWTDTMNATRDQGNHLPANLSHRHPTFYLPKPQSQSSGISPPSFY